jgi:hypothetical protein
MTRTQKTCITLAMTLLPLLSYASNGGDDTFKDVIDFLNKWASGSLGLLFVTIGFLGAAAAIAGFAPMKVMFPVFGLTIALRFGPNVIKTVFSASGSFSTGSMHHLKSFNLVDLAILMLATLVLIIGWIKSKESKVENVAK